MRSRELACRMIAFWVLLAFGENRESGQLAAELMRFLK